MSPPCSCCELGLQGVPRRGALIFVIRLTQRACLWLMLAYVVIANTNLWAWGPTWGCQHRTNRVSRVQFRAAGVVMSDQILPVFLFLVPALLDVWRCDNC